MLPDLSSTPLVSTAAQASGDAPSHPSGWLERPVTATQAGLELNSASLVRWALCSWRLTVGILAQSADASLSNFPMDA